jgi:regulator of protease activity HflC (stomatin/prohibitin superfamily)
MYLRCSSPGARAQAEGHTIQFQEADAENLPFPKAARTFSALGVENQAAFTGDLLALIEARNRSGDRTLVLPSEYLEVVIERK